MSIQESLTKKLGPLPVWAWVGIGGGAAFLLYARMKKGGGGASAAGSASQVPQGYSLLGTGNGGPVSFGNNTFICSDGSQVADPAQCPSGTTAGSPALVCPNGQPANADGSCASAPRPNIGSFGQPAGGAGGYGVGSWSPTNPGGSWLPGINAPSGSVICPPDAIQGKYYTLCGVAGFPGIYGQPGGNGELLCQPGTPWCDSFKQQIGAAAQSYVNAHPDIINGIPNTGQGVYNTKIVNGQVVPAGTGSPTISPAGMGGISVSRIGDNIGSISNALSAGSGAPDMGY